MNESVGLIIGKTVSGVIIKERDASPKIQIFLTFDDGTYYEFYGDAIRGISEVRRGGPAEVRSYMRLGRTVYDSDATEGVADDQPSS